MSFGDPDHEPIRAGSGRSHCHRYEQILEGTDGGLQLGRRGSSDSFLIPFIIVVVSAAAFGQTQPAASSSLDTRAEREAFLSKANIVNDGAPRPDATRSWRASLDDGTQKHDAGVETADGSDPTSRNYRFNVAAYELDRRRKGIDPPDPERWNRQVHAVRMFDELILNTYRDTSPPLYLNSVWGNLLITNDWTIWIVDHTGAFRIRRRLEHPESLTRCDRALLGRLRKLTRALLLRTLGKYLSSQQLDALEVRRELLVKHFDEQIARNGQAAVLYDLPPRQ